MRLFKNIAIVGVGLIGGSLGLAIKKKHLAGRVIGISRKKKTLNNARRIKAIDQDFRNFSALAECDLVILCAPVKAITGLLYKIKPFVRSGCIVTDVGSTKTEIIRSAKKILPKGVDFIGAHPLAGSEKRGITNAKKDLFEKSLCIITPTMANKSINLLKVKKLWRALGARVISLDPTVHDKVISETSHLPHMIAFSLIAAIDNTSLKYAANSLKDTTRIAASDPLLWTEIFLTNKANILKSAEKFQKQLKELIKLTKNSDTKKLFAAIKCIKVKRDRLI